MTLTKAAIRASINSPIARTLTHKPHGKAANDNGQNGTIDQDVFEASLRYFAKHGLSAAAEARQQAEKCFHADDKTGCTWWLAICRMLDRRMAAQLSKKFEAEDLSAIA
ncbi:MAG: hypothetical protein ABJP34_07345 [Erythrobacter sp.]